MKYNKELSAALGEEYHSRSVLIHHIHNHGLSIHFFASFSPTEAASIIQAALDAYTAQDPVNRKEQLEALNAALEKKREQERARLARVQAYLAKHEFPPELGQMPKAIRVEHRSNRVIIQVDGSFEPDEVECFCGTVRDAYLALTPAEG